MKIFARVCAAVLAATALPTAAGAAGITYDCDTAADHFSELVLPAPAVPFTASGNVQLNSLSKSSTYVPIVRIQVASASSPGESPDVFAGFSLTALPTKKAKSGAVQMLSYNAKGKEDEILPLSMTMEPGRVQPFRLSYDGSNVSVNLGGEAKTFPLRTGQPTLRIICSTGEFLFTDLVIEPSR
jgi:hypothetical protein